MALRFRLQNAGSYGGDPWAAALSNLGNAFLSGPTQSEIDLQGMQTDKVAIERDKLRREYAATGRLGDSVAGTVYDPAAAAEIRRQSILAGRTGADLGNLGRVYAYSTGADRITRDRAGMAAGGSAASTETGHDQDMANRLAQTSISAGAGLQAAREAEAGRMTRRWDTPHDVSPGAGVFFNPADPRFPGRRPGDVPVPQVMAPLTVNPGQGVFFAPNDPRAGQAAPGSVPVPQILAPFSAAPGAVVFKQPGDPRFPTGFDSGQVASPREFRAQNPSNLARLITERDALPQGDPARAQYDAAIEREAGGTEASAVQARRTKIKDLLRAFPGLDPARAEGLADGYIKIENKDGVYYEVDSVRGTAKQIDSNDPAAAAARAGAAPPTAPSPDATNRAYGLTTGIDKALTHGLDSTVGAILRSVGIMDGAIGPDTVSATSAAKMLREKMLRVDMIGRGQGEQGIRRDLLPGPALLEGAGEQADNFHTYRQGIIRQLAADKERLARGGAPTAERSKLIENIRQREDLLGSMDEFVQRYGNQQGVDRPPMGTSPSAGPYQPPTPRTNEPQSPRSALPQGVTVPQAIQDAKDAIKRTPAARRDIEDKLRSYGIDPGVLR
jgi:hypothetical protein